MITLNELAYDLLKIVRGGKTASSDSISLDQIKFWILNTRAQFIRNQINKGNSIDPILIQDLGCLDLEDVDPSECCDVPTECKVLRTKLQLPSAVELYQKPLITRVGPPNKMEKPYDQVSYERVPYEFLNRFTKNLVKYFVRSNNHYLYIIHHKSNLSARLLEHINVQMVLEDPRDAKDFICDGQPCYADDKAFPVKRWMVEQMKEQIKKVNLGVIAQAPTDSSGEGSHNPKPQTNA